MKPSYPWMAGLLAAAALLAGCRAETLPVEPGPPAPLRASGVFRADEILVSTQVAGTVQWLGVREGDAVAQGDVLARLDTALIDAQIAQAQAALQTAQAQLAEAKAGLRPEEIGLAEAAVQRAAEDANAAAKAVEVARGSAAAAAAALRTAQAQQVRLLAGADPEDLANAQDRVQIAQDRLAPLVRMRDDTGGLEQGGILPAGSREAAQAVLSQAELGVEVAQLQLEVLQAGARSQDLQAAQAAVDAAQAVAQASQLKVQEAERRLEAAQARVRQSQAQFELLKAGASPEQLALAEAPVKAAAAALHVLEVRRNQTVLTAPRGGLVTAVGATVGEQVFAGAVLYRLSDLKDVELNVYVRGTDVSRVRLGQVAKITTGSFPGRTFNGQVIHVSSQAEFTPNALTTSDAGTSEVFAVKIRVPNPEGLLRPGMPAEAELVEN